MAYPVLNGFKQIFGDNPPHSKFARESHSYPSADVQSVDANRKPFRRPREPLLLAPLIALLIVTRYD
jgi:hypothetical protein